MNAQEGRPSSHEVGARQSTRTTEHTTTARAFAHGHAVSTPSHRRWNHGPRRITTMASDVAVWAFVTAVVIMVIGICCAALWVAR